MADDDDKPQYTTYRSRPRAPWRKDDGGIDDLREPVKDLPPQPGSARSRPSGDAGSRSAAWSAIWRWRSARGCSSRCPVPDQRPDPVREGLRRGRGEAQRRRLPAHLSQHDPRARLRRPREGQGRAGSADDRQRPEPVGLDPAAAGRRRRQRAAVDPPRHGGGHPRPRAQQDQRRVRVRRPVAGDPDRRVLPRHRHQPPRRGQLRELPGPDRLARRHHLHGQLRDLEDQRRLAQRWHHAAPEGRHEQAERRRGADPRAHPAQRLPPATRPTRRA